MNGPSKEVALQLFITDPPLLADQSQHQHEPCRGRGNFVGVGERWYYRLLLLLRLAGSSTLRRLRLEWSCTRLRLEWSCTALVTLLARLLLLLVRWSIDRSIDRSNWGSGDWSIDGLTFVVAKVAWNPGATTVILAKDVIHGMEVGTTTLSSQSRTSLSVSAWWASNFMSLFGFRLEGHCYV
jgi:hypothetical protein